MAGVNPIDYSTLTVTDSAVTLATSCVPTLPSGAKGAIITLEDAQVRFRSDGTAASSTEGHTLSLGQTLTYDSWSVPKQNWRTVFNKLSFIRVTGVSGKLKISWFD